MNRWIIAGTAVAAGAYLLRGWLSKTDQESNRAFLRNVLEPVAELLVEKSSLTKEEATARAKTAIESRDFASVEPILTVDLHLDRTGASDVKLAIVIIYRDGEKFGKRTATLGLSWDDVPGEYRTEMLKTGSKSLRFRIVGPEESKSAEGGA